MSERLFEARELAERLGGELEGGNPVVGALGSPGDPGEGMVVVVWDKRQAGVLTASPPALTVTHDGLELPTSLAAVIRVGDARLALARLTRLFDQRRLPAAGVHPQATVSPRARLGKGVRVAAGAIIGDDAIIGDACVIGQGAIVGEGSVIGEESRLHPRATVLDGVTVGRRVILHSGSVVGSDGFGYALGGAGAVKLHHLGGVVVEDDVEIGANTCIDRGTLGDTVIGARTKIDNLCQVAHNVRIGRDCLIAGQSGIAGSSKLGDRVVMAGGAGVGDHLEVGDGAVLGPRAGVTKDVPAGQRWMGFPAQPQRAFARQSYLAGKLERIWRFVKRHEEEEV